MNELHGKAQPESSSLDAYRRLIAQLPITLRPALNQQLSQWETLFPFEQSRIATFMKGVQSFSPSALGALAAPLCALESKMGVKHWAFSEDHDTIENASLLARSESYAEWRREVQKVFEAVNAAASESAPKQAEFTRLLLLVLPANLPVDPLSGWKQWDPRGHEIKISGDSKSLCEMVVQGQAGLPGITTWSARQGSVDSSDIWLIDAEAKLNTLLPANSPNRAASLSYANLKPFRDKFLAELNKAPKNIQATDDVVAALRLESWNGWGLWPAEVADQPQMRKFVIDLFLSGNGAVIFPSAFVEWAACEVMRRARPRVIVARFGMRSKPKPFTGIAIFENQQRISSLPDVDDPENSAVDAAILARYVWLATSRYPEQEKTICLCVSEHLDSAYLILPPDKTPGWNPEGPIASKELYSWLVTQFSS
jgi:hypothetical protein